MLGAAVRGPSRRFSLLLLEEGEDYYKDWLGTAHVVGTPPALLAGWKGGAKVKGRVRLGTRSLFVDPDDTRLPIVRLALKNVSGLQGTGGVGGAIRLEASTVTTMKDGGMDLPYQVDRSRPCHWQIELLYARVEELAAPLTRFVEAGRAGDHAALRAEARRLEEAAVFDVSRLRDLGERVQLDLPAHQVTPLIREPGRLVVTDRRIYFQPLHNLVGDVPVRALELELVAAVARRRHSLRPLGLEVFVLPRPGAPPPLAAAGGDVGSGDGASTFFAFRTKADRDAAADAVVGQAALGSGLAAGAKGAEVAGSLLEAGGARLSRVTAAWQHGALSNYDYLLFLNLAAGRTFNDIAQWPVIPWVLADYTSSRLDLTKDSTFRDLSKPVGALNEDRLDRLRARYREMPRGEGHDPPFLYGTHYSAPGYVMYYLVRVVPAHMLRLQNGRFDAADRLFCSMRETWASVLTNPADVKELVPEFFAPGPAEFLLNREHLPLGRRQGGTPVGDVELPPWAQSPDDFLLGMREALECEHVSARLHQWVDLVFGAAQRGEAAVAADNVFHHATYEGSVDLDQVAAEDPHRAEALEAQINEFGQTPRQLFRSAHPPRLNTAPSWRRPAYPPGAAGSDVSGTAALLAKLLAVATGQTRLAPPPGGMMGEAAAESPPPPPAAIPPPRQQPDPPLPPLLAGLPGAGGGHRVAPPPTLAEAPAPKAPPPTSQQPGGVVPPPASTTASPASPFLPEQPRAAPMGGAAAGGQGVGGTATPAAYGGAPADSAPPSWTTPAAVAAAPSPSPYQAPGGPPGVFAGGRRGGGARESTLWNPALRSRLAPRFTLQAHRKGVTGAALCLWANGGAGALYSAGRDGAVKVFSLSDGSQARASRVGELPLSSLALSRASDGGVGGSHSQHPVVYVGSYDNTLSSYSVEYGRVTSRFRAHDDAVACLCAIDGGRVVSGSWDGAVKLWDMGEGRAGASTGDSAAEVAELDEGGVRALAADPSGALVVTGAEEGTVAAWDPRVGIAGGPVWSSAGACDGAATGLAIAPDGRRVVLSSADGRLRSLDLRGPRAGATAEAAEMDDPLLCCATDGRLAVAGSEGGDVHFWSLSGGGGGNVEREGGGAGPDGVFEPLRGVAGGTQVAACAVASAGGEDWLAAAGGAGVGTLQVFAAGL